MDLDSISSGGPQGPYDWSRANVQGLAYPANQGGGSGGGGAGGGGGINSDVTGANEGMFPYPNSEHGDGVHVVFCDGSIRFINQKVSGLVWSQLVTPAGGKLVDPQSNRKNYWREDNPTNGFTQPALNEDDIDR